MNKIKTPAGKFVTAEQYVNLACKNEKPCEHGHLDCAAWNHGPCSDELMCELEADLLDKDEAE